MDLENFDKLIDAFGNASNHVGRYYKALPIHIERLNQSRQDLLSKIVGIITERDLHFNQVQSLAIRANDLELSNIKLKVALDKIEAQAVCGVLAQDAQELLGMLNKCAEIASMSLKENPPHND